MTSAENPVFQRYSKLLNAMNDDLDELYSRRTSMPGEALEMEITRLEKGIKGLVTNFNLPAMQHP